MGIHSQIRIEKLNEKYAAEVNRINREVYEQLSNEDDQYYEKLEVGPDVRWYMEMFVPFNGYTHICWGYCKGGTFWSYARKLTAEEKEDAPKGCDWQYEDLISIEGQNDKYSNGWAKYIGWTCR